MKDVAAVGSLITTHEGGDKNCGEDPPQVVTCMDGVPRVLIGVGRPVHFVGGAITSHLYYDEETDECLTHQPVLLAGSETVRVYPEKLGFAPAGIALAGGGYSKGCKATIDFSPDATVFAY